MKHFLKAIFRLSMCYLVCMVSASASPLGKVQFTDLSAFYGAPAVEINLNQALLAMVTAFSNGQDPELSKMLNKIEEVNVRVYNLNKSPDKAVQALQSLDKTLRTNQWQPIVTVNEENEKVSILARTSQGIMDGIVVMVVPLEQVGGEAVFINIVGEIDPAQLSKVTKALNVNYGEAGEGK